MPESLNTIWNGGGGLLAILDFIIVFYLIYIILLLVRGTRTVPMALGLLLFVVLYLVSRYFGLATTYMLLDQFMDVAVIFALIIFQDDIRRALVRMGRIAWFSKAQESQVLEDVVRTAATLAPKRIGAIIVFERDASLTEFTNGGTNLDAIVTKELLHTIFIPRMENPLHDGAVVIKNYRLSEAGVVLPLSSNPRIDKSLGTRHRAALGITEETDAVSVVISEERGTISLCFGGLMSKNLDVGSLRKALHGLFSKEKIRERKKAAEERKAKAHLQMLQKSKDRPSSPLIDSSRQTETAPKSETGTRESRPPDSTDNEAGPTTEDKGDDLSSKNDIPGSKVTK